MRTRCTRTLAILATALASFAGSPTVLAQDPPKTQAASLTGRWAAALDIPDMGVANVALVFAQDGENVTGTYTGRYGAFPLEGVIKARKLEFTVYLKTDAGDSTMYFAGELAADSQSLRGTATIEGLGEATWSAKKQPDKAPR